MITACRRLLAVVMLLVSLPLAAAVEDAQQLVRSTTEQVLERLERDRARLDAEPGLVYPLVEDLVLPHFDFDKMSQWVLGRHWRDASAEQRQQFTAQFRNLLVRTYAKALLEYTGQQIDYLPLQAEAQAQRVTVRTQLAQAAGGPPIPLHYSLYLNPNGAWKVYDISVDGVSLVQNYRSSFATEIRQGGVDRLIEKLGRMNQGARDG